MPTTIHDRVAELERKNAELSRELDACAAQLKEARERQAAANAVLEAIARSPQDTRPVFEAIVESATRLCQAEFTAVARFEGGLLHLVALNNLSPGENAAFHSMFPRPALRDFAMGRSFLDGKPVQFADVLAEPGYDTRTREVLQSVIQYRSFLGVPILREGRPIGVIGCGRREARPVAEAEIAILQTFADQAAIALENTRLIAETREALAQQTATAEVLQVINGSPADLGPVFEAIANSAASLCNALNSSVYRFDGKLIHFLAESDFSPRAIETTRRLFPAPPSWDNATARAVADCAVVHIPDVLDDPDYRSREWAKAIGLRSVLSVPMLREGRPIGVITVNRAEAGFFPPSQVELLKTFAEQAVIAIENTRLITETREALAQQTATAEVLQVINSSPGDLAPVFDAMLEKAMRLCEASHGQVWRFDGEQLHAVAARGDSGFIEWLREHSPVRPIPGSAADRIARGERLVHLADRRDEDAYQDDPVFRGLVDISGVRASLSVALRRDETLLGMINVYRQEVRPFTDRQIALLQNFAAQAVIAMENARLLGETREALEQQTATAEVLQVINSSPGDLAPVFEAILDKAHTLCDAVRGTLFLFDGETFRAAAVHGYPEALAERLRQGIRASQTSVFAPLLAGARLVHNPDLTQIDDPIARAVAERGGVRTNLLLPLRKDGALIGVVSCNRLEVRPFSDKQIALLQNFAAQAVIAMENARLITETREALEQQTATAEILQVINSSPGDLAPVFGAILEKAHALCGATRGTLFLFDGEEFRAAASHGYNGPPGRPPVIKLAEDPRLASLVAGERLIHVPDLTELDDPIARAVSARGEVRTNLLLPLRKHGAVLGVLSCNRAEVRPFGDKEIALLESFAAQAVIAMENARLLAETREALDQQTATAEVLQVINSSPGDLAPVFEAMLERAMRLCEANFGQFTTYDGARFRTAATLGVPAAFAEFRRHNPPDYGPGTAPARILAGEPVVHIADLMTEGAYRTAEANRRALVDLGGARTSLVVALRKADAVLGFINIYRREVRPFSGRQIALLQGFAAQAVIAMENARLLGELRARTADLEEALEYQTATSDVLKVISRSTFDLQPVLDTLAESAATLTRSDTVFVFRREEEVARLVAQYAPTPAFGAAIGTMTLSPDRRSTTGRALATGEVVRILDVQQEPDYQLRESEIDRIGSTMAAPLLRAGETIGVMTLARLRVEPYTDRQVELVRTFADQAVIAIENARLLTELRESLEQQQAIAEVLQVINASPGDLAPVFATILEKAHTRCGATLGSLFLYDGELFRAAATHGYPEDLAQRLRQGVALTATPQFLEGARWVHNPDLTQLDAPTARDVSGRGGVRTNLMLPLRKDGRLLGAISSNRQEVRPFTDKEIALLENFAAQAVIAMENARLITETREALEQQTATAEVLQIINSSPGELQPVFEAILEKGHQLCGVTHGSLQLYDGEKFAAVAVHGLSGPLADRLREGYTPDPTYPVWRVLEGERFVHTPDLAEIDNPLARSVVALGGARTLLWVALRRDDKLFGLIAAARLEVRPFSEKEIALLESFAAQAVIAMDNARLLGEIRQRQAELRVTFDNMGDGVAMFDAGMQLAAWNRNFQQMLDLPDEFVTARPSYAEYARYLAERGEFGPADVEAEVRRMAQVVGTRGSLERTRPDGRVVEVRYNPAPDGGFVLIYGDVTERKRAEAEIRAARDTAEKALAELKTAQASLVHAEKMASLGQLTAGIAHEIKNPLNFVNNFAGLSVELLDELKEAAAPAVASLGDDMRAEIDELVGTLSGNLGKIAEHGRRADGIVTSMLAHSRGSSGERQRVDLNGLVEEALNLAYHGARAQDQDFNIAMERAFEPGLAPVEIVPQDLTRVFLNLFGNGFYAARKRARETGDGFRPMLGVTTRDLGDAVEVKVRDNGAGIPPDLRDRLFQPFFTTKPTGEGTGLGLSISYDIVTQGHGGAISVESEAGSFTEFTIRLPRRAAAI